MRVLMAKIILLLFLVCSRFASTAQQQEVAMAEQAFAQMAVDSSTKKAFLHFLDSNSLLFYEGKSHPAIPFWQNLPGHGGHLFWKPVYTGMAGSGDIGFSTGPFEQRETPAAQVKVSGNYSSIWAKNKQGEWKVIIDMGVEYPHSLFQQPGRQLEYNKPAPVTGKTNWQKIEQDCNARIRQKGYRALLPYITSDSWFNIMGQHPLHTVKDIETGLQQIPAALEFAFTGGNISAAGDLFYTYGVVTLHGKKENYLRVWGHEKDGWKLLLHVLNWVP